MKNLMFVISLIFVVLFSSCSNEDNEIITPSSPEEEVVKFNNPIILMEDNWIIVSVNVSSPRGEETLRDEFYIDNISDCNLIYSTKDIKTKPELVNVEKTLINSRKEKHGYFSYEMGEYLIMVTSELPNEEMVTSLSITLPRNISVNYEGKEFLFDDIDFNYEVNDSFERDGFNTSYYKIFFDITLGQNVLRFIGENQIKSFLYY